VGCSIDPDRGRVANADQTADVGCSIDPNGRCNTGH
jgi:hypothetical protein